MKVNFSTVFFAVCFFTLFAYSPLAFPYQDTWERGVKILVNEDDELFVIGSGLVSDNPVNSNGSGKYTYILGYDLNGDKNLFRKHEVGNYADGAIFDDDQNILVTYGFSYEIRSFDELGHFNWETRFDLTGGYDFNIEDIIIDRGNIICTTGCLARDSDYYYDPDYDMVLVLFSSLDGEYLLYDLYDSAIENYDCSWSIVENPETFELFTTGIIKGDFYSGFPHSGNMFFGKYNKNLEFQILDEFEDARGGKVLIDEEGYLVLSGNINSFSDNLNKGIIVKYDRDGARLWMHEIQPEENKNCQAFINTVNTIDTEGNIRFYSNCWPSDFKKNQTKSYYSATITTDGELSGYTYLFDQPLFADSFLFSDDIDRHFLLMSQEDEEGRGFITFFLYGSDGSIINETVVNDIDSEAHVYDAIFSEEFGVFFTGRIEYDGNECDGGDILTGHIDLDGEINWLSIVNGFDDFDDNCFDDDDDDDSDDDDSDGFGTSSEDDEKDDSPCCG